MLIILPKNIAPEIDFCENKRITKWETDKLDLGKDKIEVPFRIHLDRYELDETTFKLITYKSLKITSVPNFCDEQVEAYLLFDDEGRTFGLFLDKLVNRYLFQHSSALPDKDAFREKLMNLDFID
ncbi:MAG: hypothetical protein ACFFCS_10880 [Candidatus Hodarchaeota archaeon]